MTEEWTEVGTSATTSFMEAGEELVLHYNDCNPGKADEVIVMCHGSGPGASGWANFSRNIGPFTQVGYRVILLDFPGWSKSAPIVCTGSRSDLNARAIKGLVDALGLGRIHLVGNSMGAHSAVPFALNWPEHVGRLVLMGGGTGGISTFAPMPTEGIKLAHKVYRDPTVDNLQQMLQTFVFDVSDLTDDLARQRLDGLLAHREHLDNFVKSATVNPKQYPDYGHRLSEITAKTLIIWGRNDRFVPFDSGLRLLAGIADSELHVFNKCGHWAQWEHYQRFNTLLLDFLRN
ncbi:UNVERIFIED_ORG: 2-hydroxy-6-oxonona-2,4-dienedioate hydrolase [Xanthobacter viscosus]|uniref:Alpha/beta fold hydrolase n=1 Tax=Xanthobacter autotrophicus TaxID=280 RepID=A0A6C1KC44_XANAU|nr:alpha/beta fold hydrolase [Xanthobacter autotrophicus]TLX41371.1 alpha/beta fold hydrolase [Xanthobacter autotrophicus]